MPRSSDRDYPATRQATMFDIDLNTDLHVTFRCQVPVHRTAGDAMEPCGTLVTLDAREGASEHFQCPGCGARYFCGEEYRAGLRRLLRGEGEQAVLAAMLPPGPSNP